MTWSLCYVSQVLLWTAVDQFDHSCEQAHEVAATNSDYVVESDTIGCFLDDQDIALDPIINT